MSRFRIILIYLAVIILTAILSNSISFNALCQALLWDLRLRVISVALFKHRKPFYVLLTHISLSDHNSLEFNCLL